jgi:hypothetical protein
MLEDLLFRLFILSEGPPIVPLASGPVLLGEVADDTYIGPGGQVHFQIPPLMQPNAEVWDEQAANDNLFLFMSDDIGRWYALLVHQGALDGHSLEEWVEAAVGKHRESTGVIEVETDLGSAAGLLYRDEEQEADCGVAALHQDGVYYTGWYCLMDHFAGDEEEFGIRTFAAGYGITYEPVETVLGDFLKGLKLSLPDA